MMISPPSASSAEIFRRGASAASASPRCSHRPSRRGLAARSRRLLTVLAARGLAIDGEARARIEACADGAQLDRWLARALTAASAREALDDGAP
ncbi:MAG TPA: hypothetical protein VFS00_05600 [Polyangiaceae bacterium]|nr:hypothetical protein [Polyangiaceae bacterium]